MRNLYARMPNGEVVPSHPVYPRAGLVAEDIRKAIRRSELDARKEIAELRLRRSKLRTEIRSSIQLASLKASLQQIISVLEKD